MLPQLKYGPGDASSLSKVQGPKEGPPNANAGIWKAFSFATGDFLLHVTSGHVMQVPRHLLLQANGQIDEATAKAELEALAESLPKPLTLARPTPKITAIALNVVQRCNLRCTYCYAGDGDYGKKSQMSASVATAAVKYFAASTKQLHIIFFGGEPLLNFDLIRTVVAFCEAFPDVRFTYSVTTNGTLLNEAHLAFFKDKRFAVTVSYDGKGLQARQRLNMDLATNSQAKLERKLEAFRTQLEALERFQLRSTVAKGNLDLLENAIVDGLSSRNYALAVGRHATSTRELAFTASDVAKVGSILESVVSRLIEAKNYAALLRLEPLSTHVTNIHRGKVAKMFCSAGVNYLSVSTDGRFYLCHRFTEDAEENFGDLEHGVDLAKLAQFAAFRARQIEPCSSCWMREWCAGGCFHENKCASGNTFVPDPMFCALQAHEIEQAMRVYTHILVDAPELLG